MARSEITGRRRLRARHVSHSNIKTPRWQHVNVQKRRLWVPELSKYVTLKVTMRELRTIDKIGVINFARRHGVSIG